jgi:hypothetical protein
MKSCWKRLLSGFVVAFFLMTGSAAWAVPIVTEFFPSENSTAPPETTVTATFSEAMDPATITTGTFAVSHFTGVQAAGGYFHGVALQSDGMVGAWGDNRYGQSNVPPGLSGVVAVTAGSFQIWRLRTTARSSVGVTTIPISAFHQLASLES